MYFRSRPRMASSTRRPEASKTLLAPPTYSTWPNHGRMPRVRKIGSHAACESTVPNAPGEAPMRPTARPRKTRGTSAGGRVIQSIAFLNTPGIELLYSGVTRSSASAIALRCFDVAIVERNAADRLDLECCLLRALFERRPQQRGVEGTGPQAPGDADD